MTPKENAKAIFDKMAFEICDTDAKKCALICIDEIILFSENLGIKLYKEIGGDSYTSRCVNHSKREYLKEVKKRIGKTLIMKSLLFKSAWSIFKMQNVSFSQALTLT